MRTLVLTALVGVVAFPTTSQALESTLHQGAQNTLKRSIGVSASVARKGKRFLRVKKVLGGSELTLTFPVAKTKTVTPKKGPYATEPRAMTEVEITLHVLDGALVKAQGEMPAASPPPSPLSSARITVTRSRSRVRIEQISNMPHPTVTASNEHGDRIKEFDAQLAELKRLIPRSGELMVGGDHMQDFVSLAQQLGIKQIVDSMATLVDDRATAIFEAEKKVDSHLTSIARLLPEPS